MDELSQTLPGKCAPPETITPKYLLFLPSNLQEFDIKFEAVSNNLGQSTDSIRNHYSQKPGHSTVEFI